MCQHTTLSAQLTPRVVHSGWQSQKSKYTAYAYRTRDIVIRQAVTTWIANGCQWEDCDDYWLWVYSDQINTKLSIFGEKAAEKFAGEKINRKGGRWSPLMMMSREFTVIKKERAFGTFTFQYRPCF